MSKATLSREAFVDAALQVIDEVGVEKLSMRKVASQLGVSPMAMYKHFPNKEELLVAALDAFIAQADVLPDSALPWDEWVEQVARGMYEALCREMSWVPLLGSMRLGAQAAAVTDAYVRKLTEAGFSVEQSVQAYFAVVQIVVGSVCLRSSLCFDARFNEESQLAPATHSYLEGVDSERLRIAPALDAVVKAEQLDVGLPLIITALRAQLAAN